MRDTDARLISRRWLTLTIVSALLVAWQLTFLVGQPRLRDQYASTKVMGMARDVTTFFYFYYHFGQFPVSTNEVGYRFGVPVIFPFGPAAQDAAEFVARHGTSLLMDRGSPVNTARFGDFGKIFLLYPDAWLRRDPAHASVIPFNASLFVVALLAVLWAFWLARYPVLGVLLVIFVGSDPFQLFETYAKENIFSLPISVALIVLGVHLGFVSGRQKIRTAAWMIAAMSGVFIATVREVRSEGALIGLALPFVYLTIGETPVLKRIGLIAAFAGAYFLAGRAWHAYWDHKFEDAKWFVAAAGGRVYAGPHDSHHPIWHSVMIGLGDYGGDRGYSWDDRMAFGYAFPILRSKYMLDLHWNGRSYYFDETYDGYNHIAPTDLPQYIEIVRHRVIQDIRNNPVWYLNVLRHRAFATLHDVTPVSVAVAGHSLGIPHLGWLAFPALVLVIARRDYLLLRLLLFTLPLNLTAMLVYSGGGPTYYSIYHLVAAATCVHLLVESARRRMAAFMGAAGAVHA